MAEAQPLQTEGVADDSSTSAVKTPATVTHTTHGDTRSAATAIAAVAPLPQAVLPPAEPLTQATDTAEAQKEAGQSHQTPLAEFNSKLPKILQDAGYDEVYGVTLSTTTPTPFSTTLILTKFLRANSNDVSAAATQLLNTLKWRKDFQPLKALKDEAFSAEKFRGLGYVMPLTNVPGSTREGGNEICTFNIYGAVKDKKATFGDVDAFLRWRVALMELSLAKLDLTNTNVPIPAFGEGPDPHQSIQVHDYLSISFLRQDPNVKAASKVAIDTFTKYYPETLSRKFFVNVPAVMGWLFTAMKLVLSKETVRKFTVLSYGEGLATELGKSVPKPYGGDAGNLDEVAEQLKLE